MEIEWKLNKIKRKILESALETQIVCFSAYKNCELNINR